MNIEIGKVLLEASVAWNKFVPLYTHLPCETKLLMSVDPDLFLSMVATLEQLQETTNTLQSEIDFFYSQLDDALLERSVAICQD